MSDYRDIEIIVNVIGKDNTMTDEQARMVSGIIYIGVSECVAVDEVMEEITKRMLTIEDVL